MRWLLLWLVLCPLVVSARVARVETASGEVLEGHVRLNQNSFFLVDAERVFTARVALTNVVSASFETNFTLSSDLLSGAIESTLPGAWLERDIGQPLLSGDTRHQAGSYTIRSAGTHIGYHHDQFHFVYKLVEGDADIVARVTTVQFTHPWAKAGVMMRQDLSEYAGNVLVGVTAERGAVFQWRPEQGATTETYVQSGLSAPEWVRLRRKGNQFSAWRSPEGRRWYSLGAVNVPMTKTIYLGMAVAAGRESQLNWSTFDHVRDGRRVHPGTFQPQIVLTSGSIVQGTTPSVTADVSRFVWGNRMVSPPREQISRIIFRWLPSDTARQLRSASPGALLSNGDYLEGDVLRLDEDQLRLSSVLFGVRQFDRDEVLAVVLHPKPELRAEYEVVTADGSIWRGGALALANNEVILNEPSLGRVTLPLHAIRSMRRL